MKNQDTSQKGAMLAILVIISIVALVIIAQNTKAPRLGADVSGRATSTDDLYAMEEMMTEVGLAALQMVGANNPSVVSSVNNGEVKVTFYYPEISPELMVVVHEQLSENLPDSVGIFLLADELELTYPRVEGVEEGNLAGLAKRKTKKMY